MGRAIGIDLGTTNSCAAIMDGGKPRVIARDLPVGQMFTRSPAPVFMPTGVAAGDDCRAMACVRAACPWAGAPAGTGTNGGAAPAAGSP